MKFLAFIALMNLYVDVLKQALWINSEICLIALESIAEFDKYLNVVSVEWSYPVGRNYITLIRPCHREGLIYYYIL